ncbi:MAG: hypothetical protein AAF050_24985, partial [Cyanobacteria bacterium J06649_5]
VEGLLPLYRDAIAGKPNEIARSAIWNAGFYLWRIGRVEQIEEGFELARSLLNEGTVTQKLTAVKQAISNAVSPPS